MARKTSAKTRVKLSQAAKRRRRAPKGTKNAGAFAAGLFSSAGSATAASKASGHQWKPWDHDEPQARTAPVGRSATGSQRYDTASGKREIFLDSLGQVKRRDISDEDLARGLTRSRLMGPEGPRLSPADTAVDRPRRITRSQVRGGSVQARREAHWDTEQGLYTSEAAIRRGRYKAPSSFVSQEMPPAHRRWLQQQLADPNSEFSKGLRRDPNTGQVENRTAGSYSPGQRNRIAIYTNALQEGASHTEAMSRLQGERRGRAPAGRRKATPDTDGTVRATRQIDPEAIGLGKAPKGRKSKYESVAPGEREFQVGIDARAVDSISDLKKKFPDASEREVFKIQQFQRQYLADELMKNQKWTHETRQANISGMDTEKKKDDRVVFFTTNFGSPAPSVPADSLVGQYIIRKRKKFLQKEGLYNAKQLQGKFPDAVRDQHIIEMSTGISFGAEGRWGAFSKTGWRRGSKKSPNYGKPVPLGQQVLYDSQGRPMYDKEGNIRFSEGATRPFRFETMRDAGLRIFIG